MDKERIKETSKQLFSDSIWTLDMEDFSTTRRRVFKLVKLIRLVLDDFAKKRMGFQCVSLSYFCALALIPLFAIVFGITNGLGLVDKISMVIYNIFPTNQDIVDMLIEKSTNILDVAKSGPVGIVSALMFFWTILWMMFHVARVFNNVWGIQKVPRKIYKRFSIYFLTIILLPFILAIFGFGIASYSNLFSFIGVSAIKELTFLPILLRWLIFYALTVLTFSAMYKFIPAVHVRYKCAFTAALFSAAVFAIFQYLYLQTQMFVSRLNDVYGVIAAVPLFLIWLNYSWQIIIYGSQLSFGIQNIDTYNIPDDLTLRDVIQPTKKTRPAEGQDDK